jgi:hypothetical protein
MTTSPIIIKLLCGMSVPFADESGAQRKYMEVGTFYFLFRITINLVGPRGSTCR